MSARARETRRRSSVSAIVRATFGCVLLGTSRTKHNLRNKSTNMAQESRKCSICLEQFPPDASNFPAYCFKCDRNDYCKDCLVKWFIDASKYEYRMPPKCCSVVPLHTVAQHLTAQQISSYKAKFEEWSTPDRLYCPVSTCSAFIPPRLIKYAMSPSPTPKLSPPQPLSSHKAPSSPTTATNGSPSSVLGSTSNVSTPPPEKPPVVSCPACCISVCTSCRQESHNTYECREAELDPALVRLMERQKVKRCPKCRLGIRKMYGCMHVQCICGEHFCFYCLKPYLDCQGSCEYIYEDEYDDDEEPEEGDVDAVELRAAFDDYGGEEPPRFGDHPTEPLYTDYRPWVCNHVFGPIKTTSSTDTECYRCFKPLPSSGKSVDFMSKREITAYKCKCGMIICVGCRGHGDQIRE